MHLKDKHNLLKSKEIFQRNKDNLWENTIEKNGSKKV